MVPPTPVRRPRLHRLLVAAAAGLVLMFGGACGVGPTSLSLLAVAGTPASVVDDARGHAPVPVAAESTAPARRVVRRGVTGRAGRRAVRAGRTVVAVIAAVTTWRGPPPRRGPPLLRA